MTTPTRIARRSYLAALGAGAITATAGCGAFLSDDDGYDRVVLDPPEDYDLLRDARDRGDLAHPVYGDPVPDASARCAIRDEEITTADFEGERHSLYTFIFTRCHGACPALTSALRQVQADSVTDDYVDDVALVNVTFDPEYDSPAVIAEYDERYGVDYDLGNWYPLRPESEEAAREYVEGAFGCYFERNEDFDDHEMDDGHGDNEDFDDHEMDDGHGDHDDGHGDHDDGHGDHDDPVEPDEIGGGHAEMAFEHQSMIVFVNADGYVERTYVGQGLPTYDRLLEDVRTVVEGW